MKENWVNTTIKKKDILVCGFALFAIFFGAGNLIFPPYLGVLSGDRWYIAMFAFILSDPVLPILGVIVSASLGGRADDLGKRVSPFFATMLGMISILIIGPLYAIPRTGATTHEILVRPLFSGIPSWVSCLVFFGLTLHITLKPGKVIDFIGKYLTPALLLILGMIITISIVSPPYAMETTEATNLFTKGFLEGYQTMDALCASLIAGIVIADLSRRGYTEKKIQLRASIQTGLVAFVLLAVVYGGLTYAGATVGAHFEADVERTALLIGMVELLLGNTGKIFMGIATALACLTTSTGLVSICGNYFESISKGKLKYNQIVYLCVGISFILSQIGVDGLIRIAGPVLLAIYPVVIVLIFLSIFDKKIKYNWTYTGAVVGAFFISIIQSLYIVLGPEKGVALKYWVDRIQDLPLSRFGFEWLLPSAIAAVLFTVLSMVTQKGKVYSDATD
ncbi:MAG: branched-chain amino acid transport system II carrier protein [Peptostreptococcaceae bacterium]|nr:branched-chain amino acid transport system II carrier protein [Peptostreptococcaceae bacterium]